MGYNVEINLKTGFNDLNISKNQITNTDLILLTTRSDHETHRIETTAYGNDLDETNSLTLHEISLAKQPLCIAWMNIDPRATESHGSNIALGTHDTTVDIW